MLSFIRVAMIVVSIRSNRTLAKALSTSFLKIYYCHYMYCISSLPACMYMQHISTTFAEAKGGHYNPSDQKWRGFKRSQILKVTKCVWQTWWHLAKNKSPSFPSKSLYRPNHKQTAPATSLLQQPDCQSLLQ